MSLPVGFIAGLGAALTLVAGALQVQTPARSSTPDAPALASHAARFSGQWEYSADESINAYTGRPETAPGNARTSGRASAGTSSSGGTRPPAGGGSTGSGGGMAGPGSVSPGSVGAGPGSPDDWNVGYRGWAAAWARSAARDLLEVPWTLTIDASADSITLVDDLERSRTYRIDGKKKKYQLGAAVFNARTAWESDRLKKSIDAAGSFRMTEIYFLSEDASRLFVIIRLGDPEKVAKDTPPAGVNRVYDRLR